MIYWGLVEKSPAEKVKTPERVESEKDQAAERLVEIYFDRDDHSTHEDLAKKTARSVERVALQDILEKD